MYKIARRLKHEQRGWDKEEVRTRVAEITGGGILSKYLEKINGVYLA